MNLDFINLNKEEYHFEFNHQTHILCLLDLSNNNDLIINLKLNENNKIKVYLLSFNKQLIKPKTIHFKCWLNGNNNQLLIVHDYFLNQADLFVKFKGYDKPHLTNNCIDLKVNTIIEDQTSKFKIRPIYDFYNQDIDAKHSLNIGTINYQYLDYLMSRGIDLNQAKLLIYQSKINNFINNISNKADIKEIKNQIQTIMEK